ncbi:MAG: isoprenyl transferase [Desulfobacteraceae bacterium]|nr:isoprenyl transferase [Desulfobacteraceae bacterium]
MITIDPNKLPEHVAIIMDGNGRWAKKRSINRVRGHQQGAETVREIVRTSREMGLSWLTLYAFSEENWKRPQREIGALMKLLKRFLKGELEEMQENGIRLQSIGRIEKLPEDTRKVLFDVMDQTASNKDMVLTLALSYGGRQEILDATRKIGAEIEKGNISADEISEQLISNSLYSEEMPDPELLIRTSGEYRVSNFLLWQIAYTEIYITPTLWPDFSKDEYLEAIQDFQKRKRRFGGTKEE